MFYYLLYNSSFSFIVDNRLFSTILYGSILYILTHAILNYCRVELLEIINNYFWIVLTLDIISLIYGVYQSLMLEANNSSTSNNNNSNSNYNSNSNMDVTFNLLKNQINTISSYFNKKNEISIAEPVPTPRAPLRIQTAPPQSSHNPYASPTGATTPMPTTAPGTQSTPLSMLRGAIDDSSAPSRNTRIATLPVPIIYDDDNLNRTEKESIAGSDVGSIMDLDDFERSL